jgi:hypothetical protein
VNSCACAHISAPEGVPADIEVAADGVVLDLAIPAVAEFEITVDVVAVMPRGPGPPSSLLPIFLRDLSLRL